MALEKQAELSADDRFKSKFEMIKTYFDSSISKILMHQGGLDKSVELGRELCALKLVIDKLEGQNQTKQYEKEALEVSLKYFKEQLNQQHQKNREGQVKVSQMKSQETKAKGLLEKKKQANLVLEKEVLKLKEVIEEKGREVMKLVESGRTEGGSKREDSEEKYPVEEKMQEQQKKIGEMQDKLMEIRSQHIQELEEMKTQYDLEIAEAKRDL